jgi:hypothetical protein
MTILKRLYLIFVLMPLAIICTLWIMLVALIEHIINNSKIKKY